MSLVLGIGIICAIGEDVAALGTARAEVARVGAFDNPLLNDTPFVQGQLDEAAARDALGLAARAGANALNDAGLDPDRDEIALVLATGAGDTRALESGDATARPYDLAQRLADRLGCRGVTLTVATACSSSSYGVSLAEDLLAQGHGHVLLCGVEAKSDSSQYTFKSLMALDPDGCFPFAEKRRGTVLGPGAAALVLGNGAEAGQRAYGRIAAASLTCDGYHDTAPEPEGLAVRRGIRAALGKAGCGHADIDLFVPHATGTRLNDEIEQRLLSEEFGGRARDGQVLLLKGHIGHTGGASSAFSMAAAALALSEGRANAALIGASAFGGNNAAVVMTRTGFPQAEGCA